MIWLLPAIFVLIHDPSGDSIRSYEGQFPSTISGLLTNEGKIFDFIDQNTYDAFIKAHPPTQRLIDPVIQQQIQNDLFNLQLSTNTTVQKLPALLDLLKLKGLLQ